MAGREIVKFPFKIWSLVGCSCPKGWSYTQAYIGNINRIIWIFFKKKKEEDMKLEKRCVDDSLREVEQSSGRLT